MGSPVGIKPTAVYLLVGLLMLGGIFTLNSSGNSASSDVGLQRATRDSEKEIPPGDAVVDRGQRRNMKFESHRSWAPLGVAQFHEMVRSGFFNKGFGIGIFRCVPNFVLQFGIHGDPEIGKVWRDRPIKDDKVIQSNSKGFLTYASADGCEVLGKIEMKYREKPNQGTIQNKGNEYLKADFPDLDYITGAFFE
eukprot:gene1530-28599_t